MRYLAIDYGRRYLGTALTDPGGLVVLPHIRYDSKGVWENKLNFIMSLVQEKEVAVIVLGYPAHLDGGTRNSPVVKEVLLLKEALENNGLQVALLDERYTTVGAARELKTMNLKPGKMAQALDPLAACYILEMYLQRLKNKAQ